MPQTTDQRTPDEIERDIRETQEEMSRTARQIEGELSPRNILDSLLDKAGQSGVDSGYLIDVARRNPLALGMITIGGLWLVSDADARPSALKLPMGGGLGKSSSNGSGHDDWHPDHRSYVEHMSRCERRADEDDESYRRRRDHTRASYFMLEQGHDEDESTFRQRLDDATEKMRRRREQMSERTRAFAGHTRERTQQTLEDARGFYSENPLLSGLAAAFVGAVAGSALPATRAEEDYVGSWGEQAIDAAGARARQAGGQARKRKDEMLDQVDSKLGIGDQDGEGGSERPPRFGEEG